MPSHSPSTPFRAQFGTFLHSPSRCVPSPPKRQAAVGQGPTASFSRDIADEFTLPNTWTPRIVPGCQALTDKEAETAVGLLLGRDMVRKNKAIPNDEATTSPEVTSTRIVSRASLF